MRALDAKTDGLTVSSNATWTSLSLYFGFNPRAFFFPFAHYFRSGSVFSTLLKSEAGDSSRTCVSIYQTTRCHITEDLHCCGNGKYPIYILSSPLYSAYRIDLVPRMFDQVLRRPVDGFQLSVLRNCPPLITDSENFLMLLLICNRLAL